MPQTPVNSKLQECYIIFVVYQQNSLNKIQNLASVKKMEKTRVQTFCMYHLNYSSGIIKPVGGTKCENCQVLEILTW